MECGGFGGGGVELNCLRGGGGYDIFMERGVSFMTCIHRLF